MRLTVHELSYRFTTIFFSRWRKWLVLSGGQKALREGDCTMVLHMYYRKEKVWESAGVHVALVLTFLLRCPVEESLCEALA